MFAPLLKSSLSQTLDDRALLDQFRRGDEEAFTQLVRRHGPMVLGVCERILRRRHDAEDAFQAVFLILTQKVAKLGRDTTLASWLYGVALRTSWAARRSRLLRDRKERRVARAASSAVGVSVEVPRLADVLDRELAVLPTIYRVPLLLCLLQGRSRHDAARVLGCGPGTLSGRLARGKRLLARRLARHGFTATLLTTTAVGVQHVSATLLARTVAAHRYLTRPDLAASCLNPALVSLTHGVIQAMWWTKVKACVAVLGIFLVAVTGVSFGWQDETQGRFTRGRGPRTKNSLQRPPHEGLKRTISINWRNKTLVDICDELSEILDTKILVDKPALEERSLGKGELTIALDNVPAETVFKIVLLRFGVESELHSPENYILVTTAEARRARSMVVRHYPVHDVLEQRKLSPKDLERIIREQIEPGSWKDLGGNTREQVSRSAAGDGERKVATIQYYPIGVTLVISQTRDVHDRIESFLRSLRNPVQNDAHGKTTPVEEQDGKHISQVFRLKHTKAAELAPILRKLYQTYPDVTVGVDETNNSLIFHAPERIVKGLQTLLETHDLPADQKLTEAFTLKHANAARMAQRLMELFPPSNPAYRAVPDVSLNGILAIGNQEWLNQVRKFVQLVDDVSANGTPTREAGEKRTLPTLPR